MVTDFHFWVACPFKCCINHVTLYIRADFNINVAFGRCTAFVFPCGVLFKVNLCEIRVEKQKFACVIFLPCV